MENKGIIISGGWGYGNLGDDALLLATVNIIRNKYPHKEIFLYTYDVESAESILYGYSNITIKKSLHALMYDSKIKVTEQIRERIISVILKKFFRRWFRFLENKKNKKYLQDVLNWNDEFLNRNSSYFNEYIEICNKCNLYIMSGGGYINDWSDMLASKYTEAKLAHSCNLRCYMIGQTIGPFVDSISREIAHELLTLMNNVFFRDETSIEEAKLLGCVNFYKKAVPDLALSDSCITKTEKEYITYIPFDHVDSHQLESICINLIDIAKGDNNCILLTVSQLWYPQVQLCNEMFFKITKYYKNVKLIIPSNLNDLQQLLVKSKICISGNLHGLILSYRVGTPIICLNNRRKFLTFMKMIDSSDQLLPIESINKSNLYKISKLVMSRSTKTKSFKHEIMNVVNFVLPE